jgi:hypothetical protein
MTKRGPNDIRPVRNNQPANNFYETMPLTAMPHSLYRDDEPFEDTTANEQAELAGRLTALVTLAAVTVVVIALVLLIIYGFSALGDASSTASASSGSLEL